MKNAMNTINQTFNWSRFGAAIRKELLENHRIILFSVIGIYGLLTLFMLFGNLINHTPYEVEKELAQNNPQSIVNLFFIFFLVVIASMAFSALNTKQGRTSMFMSPSSTLEKYLVNVLIYIVAMFVIFFVCAQLADLTRIAFLKPFEDDGEFVVPGPISYLGILNIADSNIPSEMQDFYFWSWLSIILSVLSSVAIYFLGSVFWPRLSLLKTFGAIFVIQFVILILCAIFIPMLFEKQVFSHWFNGFVRSGNLFRVLSLIEVILAVVAFALSWYLFKRKDVVSLKWWK